MKRTFQVGEVVRIRRHRGPFRVLGQGWFCLAQAEDWRDLLPLVERIEAIRERVRAGFSESPLPAWVGEVSEEFVDLTREAMHRGMLRPSIRDKDLIPTTYRPR